MLDAFTEVLVKQASDKKAEDDLVKAMMKLPMKDLQKIAATGKVAYLLGDEETADKWLAKYEGTPLYDEALALEEQLLKVQAAGIQKRMAEPRDDLYVQEDMIRLKKRQLDLDLLRGKGSSGGDDEEDDEDEDEEEVDAKEAAARFNRQLASFEQPLVIEQLLKSASTKPQVKKAGVKKASSSKVKKASKSRPVETTMSTKTASQSFDMAGRVLAHATHKNAEDGQSVEDRAAQAAKDSFYSPEAYRHGNISAAAGALGGALIGGGVGAYRGYKNAPVKELKPIFAMTEGLDKATLGAGAGALGGAIYSRMHANSRAREASDAVLRGESAPASDPVKAAAAMHKSAMSPYEAQRRYDMQIEDAAMDLPLHGDIHPDQLAGAAGAVRGRILQDVSSMNDSADWIDKNPIKNKLLSGTGGAVIGGSLGAIGGGVLGGMAGRPGLGAAAGAGLGVVGGGIMGVMGAPTSAEHRNAAAESQMAHDMLHDDLLHAALRQHNQYARDYDTHHNALDVARAGAPAINVSNNTTVGGASGVKSAAAHMAKMAMSMAPTLIDKAKGALAGAAKEGLVGAATGAAGGAIGGALFGGVGAAPGAAIGAGGGGIGGALSGAVGGWNAAGAK